MQNYQDEYARKCAPYKNGMLECKGYALTKKADFSNSCLSGIPISKIVISTALSMLNISMEMAPQGTCAQTSQNLYDGIVGYCQQNLARQMNNNNISCALD